MRCCLNFILNNLFSYFIILQLKLGIRFSFNQINFVIIWARLSLVHLISEVFHLLSVDFTNLMLIRFLHNGAVGRFPDLAWASQLFLKPVLLNADELVVYVVLGNFLWILLQTWRSRSSFVLTLLILWKTLIDLVCEWITKYMV